MAVVVEKIDAPAQPCMRGTLSATHGTHDNASGGASMNLAVWYPAMFVLGVAAMGLCLMFVDACDRI
jgi:hypothetical protein